MAALTALLARFGCALAVIGKIAAAALASVAFGLPAVARLTALSTGLGRRLPVFAKVRSSDATL